jgi:hypothetical protein
LSARAQGTSAANSPSGVDAALLEKACNGTCRRRTVEYAFALSRSDVVPLTM